MASAGSTARLPAAAELALQLSPRKIVSNEALHDRALHVLSAR